MKDLVGRFKTLINSELPAAYTSPVRFNHCFNRIVLDWLFQDCWYNHLDRRKTAVSQLDAVQLQLAITRMEQWMQNPELLILDNNNSLRYRQNFHSPHKLV